MHPSGGLDVRFRSTDRKAITVEKGFATRNVVRCASAQARANGVLGQGPRLFLPLRYTFRAGLAAAGFRAGKRR
jgi:hypothetical protein